MSSRKLLGRTLLLPLLLVTPGCSLFAGARVSVLPTPPACSNLLPDNWLKGVPSADIDNDGATIGDWQKFGDAQTGQLDKANDHYTSAIGVIKRCEDRDRAAVGVVAKKTK